MRDRRKNSVPPPRGGCQLHLRSQETAAQTRPTWSITTDRELAQTKSCTSPFKDARSHQLETKGVQVAELMGMDQPRGKTTWKRVTSSWRRTSSKCRTSPPNRPAFSDEHLQPLQPDEHASCRRARRRVGYRVRPGLRHLGGKERLLDVFTLYLGFIFKFAGGRTRPDGLESEDRVAIA